MYLWLIKLKNIFVLSRKRMKLTPCWLITHEQVCSLSRPSEIGTASAAEDCPFLYQLECGRLSLLSVYLRANCQRSHTLQLLLFTKLTWMKQKQTAKHWANIDQRPREGESPIFHGTKRPRRNLVPISSFLDSQVSLTASCLLVLGWRLVYVFRLLLLLAC